MKIRVDASKFSLHEDQRKRRGNVCAKKMIQEMHPSIPL